MSKRKVLSPLGSTTHSRTGTRAHKDYYATPPFTVNKLLERENFSKRILEPCCGEGHISGALKEAGHIVFSYDLIDRGYGKGGKDFLARTKPFKGDIITNPPYSLATLFVRKSLELVNPDAKVAMLLKLGFLSGKGRRELYKTHPPKKVWVFTTRIMCGKNGDLSRTRGGAVDYAWFIWEKGYQGLPTVDWIELEDKEGRNI